MKKSFLVMTMIFFTNASVFADVFITEIADPNNNGSARFVELFNNGTSDVDLGSGWALQRYTNAYTDPQSPVYLTGTIPSNGFYIICNDGTTFASTYGFSADQDIGTGGPADSNGDDNIQLLDPSGSVIDIFGVPGEDGSGTNHEFEDGRAERISTITSGNPVFDASEWDIDNDSGGGDGPQDAPDDFDPNIWFSYVDPVTPPSILSAFSISDTEIEVSYSENLSSVVVADYSLTGTSGATFTTAAIDSSDSSLVHLTTTSAIPADVTLDTLADTVNSTDYEFYAGITSIALTNTNNPDGTIDNTHTATFQGIVSANDDYNNVWISDAEGEYNGVLIFDYSFDGLVAVGDEILITAVRDVYSNLTELKNPSLINTISTGNAPYSTTVIPGSDIADTLSADTNPGEKWEGQLVKIDGALVDSTGDYFYRCTDDGGTTYFNVGDNVDYHLGSISLTVGSTYNIVGVVDFDNGQYRINPRDANDVDGLLKVVNPLPDISVDEDSPDTTLGDLNAVFDDPDDALTFSHSNSDTMLVEVIVIGDTVTLSFYPDANGDAELVFSATSTSGDSISDTVIVTVLPVNDAPQSFDLVGPVNDTYIEITPDNLNEVLTFSWEASIDVDGDTTAYSLLGTDSLVFLSVDAVVDTFIDWSYEDLAAAIDSIDVATGTWTIIASDDELNTEAGNGPFTLTIDATALSVDKVELIPEIFALHQNYPNPFNPVTTIAYDLPEASKVKIDIYNILGQKVRTLVNGLHEPAFHKVVWDSRDDYGKSVPTGMYIYRITATDPTSGKTNFTRARKLVMIK